jgi:tetratricopeptide (TPR) repeat protein
MESVRATACLLLLALFILAADTPAELFDRAVRALNSGDNATAESALDQLVKSFPDHLGALQNLGLVYSRTGRLDQAIAIYRRALTVDPRHRGVLTNLGLALVKRHSYVEALPIFRTLFELYPDAAAARDTGLLLQLAAVEPGLLQLVPSPVAEFVHCRLDGDAERFDSAAAHCRAALSVAGARRELGRALVGLHDSTAIAELAAAIRDNPTDPEAHYYLGVALVQNDRPTDAAQSLERSRQLDPNFWGTWFYLGKVNLKLNHADASIPLLQKAAELKPDAPTVFYELGLALKAAGRSDDARRAMDRVRVLRARELHADQEALIKR